MNHIYTFPTVDADDILKKIATAGADFFIDPDVAKPDDIVGVIVSTKSQSGRDSYALSYHIDQFIIAMGDGEFDVATFRNMSKERQPAAALLSMHINQLNLAHTNAVREALDHIDDQEGDLYAEMAVMPNLILVSREHYEDFMEIDEHFVEENQGEIDRNFVVLCHKQGSSHEVIQYHQGEARDLKILEQIVPIMEDYMDKEEEPFAMRLDK